MIGGTVNQSGGLVLRAEKIGRDTMLARIVDLVAKAQRSRAPIQRLADRVAGWFVPAVIAAALLAFAAWMVFGPEPRFTFALVAAVTVLIIACPCALGLATPMSIMVGVGRGAQSGILIRDAEALERLERIDTLVIDKTGTLTEGKPKVVADRRGRGRRGKRIAAAGGQCRARQRASAGAGDPQRGQGARSSISARSAISSRMPARARPGPSTARPSRSAMPMLMAELNVATQALDDAAEAARQQGATAIYVAIDGRVAGVIAIADPIKPSAQGALAALRGDGLRIVMLTGDNLTTARAVAKTARHRRGRGRRAAGAQERGGAAAARRGPPRRDGR